LGPIAWIQIQFVRLAWSSQSFALYYFIRHILF
jgi:hypothetical protein